MKKLSVWFWCFWALSSTWAQTPKWFQAGKPYLTLKVAETGIFSVSGNVVQGAGLGMLKASQLQMFRKGQQISIKVLDANANDWLDQDDKILFYGEKNDGYLDRQLYLNAAEQVNPYQNLHTDTSSYFLTYSDTGPWLRVQSATVGATATPIRHHTQTIHKNFKNIYARGTRFMANEPVYGSLYAGSIGFGGEPVTNYLEKVPLDELAKTSGQDLKVASRLIGIDSDAELPISSTYGAQVQEINNLGASASIINLAPAQLDYTIPIQYASTNDSIYLQYTLQQGLSSLAFAFAYIHVEFPQLLFWDVAKSTNVYQVKGVIGAEHTLTIKNLNSATLAWNVSDQGNIQELIPSVDTVGKFGFKMLKGDDKLLISNTSPKELTAAKLVSFDRPPSPRSNLFLIVTHEVLQQKSSRYDNPVRAYASYRASAVGGGYDTMIVNTDDLYNYYTFGDLTPLAIRRLCEDMCADTSMIPKALFLVGKGYAKYDENRNFTPGKHSYVPTWNDPGTDVPFSMGLGTKNKKFVQAIPTGRLSVKSSQQVENYLSKLIEHEQLNDDLAWKKNIIHLSGGGSTDEYVDYKGVLAGVATIARGPYLGANVRTYAKNRDEFIEVFDLSKQLDEGASLVTLLGHSSAHYNDVRIGAVNDPTFNYKNKGKYPIIYLNGCESGNIFGGSDDLPYTFAETWINEADRGSVGFYAHTNLGYVPDLKSYLAQFYRNWFTDSLNISKPFGEIVRITSNDYVTNQTLYSDSRVRHIHQMTFMGDPLVRIFKKATIDFSIESQDVQLLRADNKPITALSDTFQLKFIVRNRGIVPKNQNVNIVVKRILPNGSEVLVSNLLKRFTTSTDTVKVKVTLADINSAGENRIVISIDPGNSVKESNENNNQVEILRFLPASDMNCLFPKEFSIQNKKVLNLVAQSTDLLKTEQDYLIEIDTSFGFNSPAYQSKVVRATSLPTWENLNLFEKLSSSADSVEFFWRIKFAANGVTEALYANSSFIYITNGRPGWNQSKFHQLDNDIVSQNLLRDTLAQKLDFVNYKLNILATASIQTTFDFIDSNQLYINEKPIYSSSFTVQWDDGWWCCQGLILSAFDQKTLRIYKPKVATTIQPPRWYGSGVANESAISRFLFYHSSVLEDLNTYLDAIPHGDYVLLNPLGAVNFSALDVASKEQLDKIANKIGTNKLDGLTGNAIYGVFFRKGYGIVTENLMLNPTPDKKFILKVDTVLFNPQGNITSTIIGPATSWGNLYFDIDKDAPEDSYAIDVIGLNAQGVETVLFQNVTQNGFDLSGDLAKAYPFLKLRAHIEDLGRFTPPVLDRWMVTYGDDIPEGTLVVDKNKVTYNTIFKKDEGDQLKSEFMFKNISDYPFKSPLIVGYTIKNGSGKVRVEYDTIAHVLLPGATDTLVHTYNTLGFAGENTIEIFVNPKIQKEILYSNNMWTSKFNIKKDLINPVMEVTFDGRKILNGEIVSPTPFIQISITDENKYLLKTDTSGIKVLLKKNCNSCEAYTLIPLSDSRIKYYPATKGENTFRIEYTPDRLEDDSYTLCVQGADANNNFSGLNPYCIEFQVINKSMMSHVYPFPNPFTNHTRFVFTLTGDAVPDEMKIQIMTVSGKVVKEILQTDIGPLRIGTNVSEYAWDGTDEYGDKLANGVYLYKVFAKHSGAGYEQYLTGGDKAFKQDWGKLVILR